VCGRVHLASQNEGRLLGVLGGGLAARWGGRENEGQRCMLVVRVLQELVQLHHLQ